MKTISYILRALMVSLLAIVGTGPTWADNFVDEINAKSYGQGQHVIYELNVGSYTSEGTFNAAQKKLAELKSLGVDIVWLMPVYPRDGDLNSPYAATDFKAVNPSYGTISDLKNYVAAAHALQMQVWLDWVPNHTSTKNVWVTKHPEYYTKDSEGNMIHPSSGSITYNDVYQLNYNNSALQDAMNDCLKFWIDQADIDGFRCDMVSSNEIPASYWEKAIPLIKNYKQGKTITFLGEGDFSNSSQARLRNVGFEYDYAWNFQEGVLQNNIGSSDRGNSLKVNAQNFVTTSKTLGVGRMLYLTNHDQNWNGDKKTLSQKYGANKYLFTVLTYTLYGMPLVYNGQETGGEQELNYFTDTKIDWNQADAKMKNTLRTLGALKHSQAALHDGKTSSDNADVSFLSTTNSNQYIVAYSRKSGDSEVIVILNLSSSDQTAVIDGISGDYSLWLNSATIGAGIGRTDHTFTGELSVSVPAKGYLVYVKGKYGDSFDDDTPVISELTDNSPVAIFYESDAANASVHAWFWNGTTGGESYTSDGSGWPGDAMTQLGKTTEGKYIYKIQLNLKEGIPLPSNLIITENGSEEKSKTVNSAEFVNHGYYVKGSNTVSKTIVVTGIKSVTGDNDSQSSHRYYDLSGRIISKPLFGIYIHNGKKYIAR